MNHEGWTCPTCRRTYAPWVPSCDCVNSAVGVNTTLSITPHADDTAELVEALKDVTAALMAADPKAHFKADVERAEAALARAKGGER